MIPGYLTRRKPMQTGRIQFWKVGKTNIPEDNTGK